MRGGVGKKLRSAGCISGKDEVGSGDGVDLLGALPDDMLLQVLCCLPSAAAAAQTNGVSRRWRHLWARLPELQFPHPADLVRVRAALAAHTAPAIHLLRVVAGDADPGDATAVLRLAAARLTGRLSFLVEIERDEDEDEDEAEARDMVGVGTVELPCFDRAEHIDLRLSYIGLALPPAGVFAKLTVLNMESVHFDGPETLSDVVSSARCPSLQELCVIEVRGLSNLTLHSETLLDLFLNHLEGFEKLTVVSPKLRTLEIVDCFLTTRQPVADVSAPALEMLHWVDEYDPSSVRLAQPSEAIATVSEDSNSWPSYCLSS